MPNLSQQLPSSKYPLNEGNQLLFDFAQKLVNSGKLDKVSSKKIEDVLNQFKNKSKEDLDKFIDRLTPLIRTKFKKEYNKYIKKGYTKTNPGINAYKINDLKPKFKKELKNSIDNSLGLIKTQNEQTMNLLEQRFRNWANIPSKELRASLTNPKKILSNLKENILNESENKYRTEKHLQFIIKDQTNKMLGAMDKITADEIGAIGFIWKTTQDNKVVGTPGGLYPEGTKAHEDHYDREGKFYIYKDSWAVKNGYIVPRNRIGYSDQIKDGMPSIPIGCRCWAKSIYDLEDIPSEYKSIITKKGQEFIDRV